MTELRQGRDAHDVDEICLGAARGRARHLVGRPPDLQGARQGVPACYRPPGRTAVDPETGEPYDDLLVIQVADASRRSGPWSTTSGCRSSPSTTSTATTPSWSSRAGSARSSRDELAEIITDAWLTKAPKSLAKAFLEPMAEPRSRGQQRATPPAAAPRGAGSSSTRPAPPRSTCSRRSASTGAYTNLVLPAAIRALPAGAAATRRSPPSWRRARSAGGAPTTRSWPPASTGRCPRSRRRCSTRCGSAPTSCSSMRVPDHAAISTTVDLVRARVSTGRRRLRQRGAPHGQRARPRRVDREGRARRRLADPVRRVAYSHPEWVVDELRAAVGSDAELRRAARRRQRAARGSPWSPVPAARPATSCRGSRPPYSPYGVVLEGGDPRSVPAVAEGRAGVQDEGSQLVAIALAAAPLEGRDELLARPLRRARRQGRAARRAGRRARRRAGRLRAASRTGPGWSGARSPRRRGRACAGVVAADGTAAAVPRRVLRPGPRRRALHRAGRAAAPARGAVAAPARRPARPGAAAAAAAPRPPSTWCVPAAWSSTRPARR